MLLERRARVIELARGWPGPKLQSRPEKRTIGIEELLRWAYCEELPKERVASAITMPNGFASAWASVEKCLSNLSGAESARVNRYGLVTDFTASRAPHHDAVAIAKAVAELDGMELGLPDDWDPFADLGGMGGLKAATIADVVARLTAIDAVGVRRLKSSPARVVIVHAIMGGHPDWRAETPEVKFVCGANGRPSWFVRKQAHDAGGFPFEFEADGMSSRSKRPVNGAYRKQYLDPDPVDAGISRGEYEIWRAALDCLVEMLAGRLESAEPEPSTRPPRPWEVPECAPRVLADINS